MAVVLLDLWGVVVNHEEMDKAYRLRMSEILQGEFGGDRRTWLRAHDEAYVWYVERFAEAARHRPPFREFVDRVDREHIQRIFASAGVPFPPADPLPFARDLERRILERSAAAYPDVPKAIAALREGGHRLFIATQASEWNAGGALKGAGLDGRFDGVLTGYGLDAFKSDPRYWAGALARLRGDPGEVVAVDDSPAYLGAAASVGIAALLLDRLGVHPPGAGAPGVRAVLRHLAGLPHFLESGWAAR